MSEMLSNSKVKKKFLETGQKMLLESVFCIGLGTPRKLEKVEGGA